MRDLDDTAPATASSVVAACEAAWHAFQARHPELPDAVIVLGSGVERGQLVKLGHWWGGRWEVGDRTRGEVLLAGEALRLPVAEVFEVLLHEAAHGLNAGRGVKDDCRGGRYHNARFKEAAIEVGLEVAQMAQYGWARTTLTEAAASTYAVEIAGLQQATRMARRLDAHTSNEAGRDDQQPGAGDSSDTRGKGSVALACGCGRRVRMAPSIAAQGPVLCGLCGAAFESSTVQRQPAAAVVSIRPVGSEPASSGHLANGEQTPSLVARAADWAHRHGEQLDEALIAADENEARQLNALARSWRRRLGHLGGHDIAAGDMLLAAGEQVVVTTPGPSGPPQLPPAGVLGQVVAVDESNESVMVDFPIAGRYRISTQQASECLLYGYAVTTDVEALPHQRELASPEVTPEPPNVVDLGLP